MATPDLKCVLAIDLGSSGPKVSVVDQQCNILASRSGTFHTMYSQDGIAAEQDTDDWWDQVLRLSREVLAESGAAQQIVAISNCAQYFSSIPVDRDGRALHHAIMWEDTRASKYIKRIMSRPPAVMGYNVFKVVKWLRTVGIPPLLNGVDAGSHMLLLKNEMPDVWAKTYKVLEPSDFITMRFTGRMCTNENTGFAYAMIRKAPWSQGTFDNSLPRELGLDESRLPEVVPVGTNVGAVLPDVAAQLGIRADVQVFSGILDTTGFTIGGGAFEDYEMVIDHGTTLTASMQVPARMADVFQGTFALTSPVQGKYNLVAELGSGNKSLNFLVLNLLRRDDSLTRIHDDPDHYAAIADRMAAEAPVGSHGVMFLPWIYGSSFPELDHDMRGGFIGLAPTVSRADMVRAVFEANATTLRWGLEIFESITKKKVTRVRLVGGGALWHTFAQICADALQVPVHIPQHPRHVTTQGVAYMCLHNLGITTYPEIKTRLTDRHIYHPDPQQAEFYTKRLKLFQKLYKKMRGIYRDMNEK